MARGARDGSGPERTEDVARGARDGNLAQSGRLLTKDVERKLDTVNGPHGGKDESNERKTNDNANKSNDANEIIEERIAIKNE